MKLSNYFLTPGVRSASTFFGLVTGLCTLLFSDWRFAVLVGASTAVITSLILPLLFYRADKPYFTIKSTLPQPFLIDERVRFVVRDAKGGYALGGFFVLTQERMVFLSLSEGEHRVELSRADVHTVRLGDPATTLRIFLNETHYVEIISASCEEMYEILAGNGWL